MFSDVVKHFKSITNTTCLCPSKEKKILPPKNTLKIMEMRNQAANDPLTFGPRRAKQAKGSLLI